MHPIPKKRNPLTPYWETSDHKSIQLYQGHVTDVLAKLPEKSVHCVVTSPPYWGLRDYGTGTWEGGDPACDHVRPPGGGTGAASPLHTPDKKANAVSTRNQYTGECRKCGATRTDMQLGSEPSPDCGTQGKAQCGRCFVCSMLGVFREVRRVLRDDGTLWLNLGDSYAGGGNPPGGSEKQRSNAEEQRSSARRPKIDIPSGNLVGVPWRVALALQADGWYLRQDIIWHKPSPMPESVRNRCTKAHEYVFLLTKSQRYYCDMEAIKENLDRVTVRKGTANEKLAARTAAGSAFCASTTDNNGFGRTIKVVGSNKRSVWTVAAQGYAGAHFATFPEKLIEPMIKAGTSEKGCCPRCKAPWKRVVEEKKLERERPNAHVKYTPNSGTNSCPNTVAGIESKTVGWEANCDCGIEYTIPCTVLDPFIGSGTTCGVSISLGRRSVGIDLSEVYLRDNAIPRIEGELLKIPKYSHLAGKEASKILIGRSLLKNE